MTFASQRVGYVLKVYPRFSETFIVNEILALEAAGLAIEIFSLRSPVDGRFHEALARVRAPVTYLSSGSPKGPELWRAIGVILRGAHDGLWSVLAEMAEDDVADVYQALLLAQAVKNRDIAHLHAHFGSVATTVARLASRLSGVSYSFTAHAKDIFHQGVRPADLRRKLDDAAAVVTVSDHNLRYLQDRYGPAASRVRRVYNGLDLTQFIYAAPVGRPRQVVAVGRLVEKKGFTDLVTACAILRDRGLAVPCDIIGAGPLQSALQVQIDRLGLSGQVVLRGPQPQHQVMTAVQRAAAFVAPCVIGLDGNRDGLPTVLLEAMALGTPVVSTDVTGIPEIVRHEQTGLLVGQHDPGSLADAIARLLANQQLRQQLAQRARALIEAEFDVHCNVGHLREVFAAVSATRTFTASAPKHSYSCPMKMENCL